MIKSVLEKKSKIKVCDYYSKEKKAHKKHDEVVKKLQGGIEKYSCNQCEKKFCRPKALRKKHGKSTWRKRALLCPMQ